MNNLPSNIREDLLEYVPQYVLQETSCFVLGDHHPMAKLCVDVTVCTYTRPGTATVKELTQRELVKSLLLDTRLKPTQITFSRNENCELFYLVACEEELFLINGEKFEVLRKICNIVVYDISDSCCSGQARLRVMSTDHLNALEFDSSYNVVQEIIDIQDQNAENLALTHLQRKLTAARYNVAHNEKLLEDYKRLRQSSTFEIFQSMHQNLGRLELHNMPEEISVKLKICVTPSLVKVFNNKLIIIFNITNEFDEPITEINVLIGEDEMPTMVYECKLFKESRLIPYWEEIKEGCTLQKSESTAITIIVDVDQLLNYTSSKIAFNGLISYKIEEKEKYIPLERIVFTSKDIMGEKLNLLCSNVLEQNEILSLMAASLKSNLLVQSIDSEDTYSTFINVLTKSIGMEYLNLEQTLLICKKSPHHTLYGVLVILEKSEPTRVTVFSRTQSQVVFLTNLIQDSADHRIIITTPHHRVTARTDSELAQYNYSPPLENTKIDVENLTKSLLKQVKITREYFEDCMAAMHESNNEKVKSIIDKAVDVYACGSSKFEEYKKTLVDEIGVSIDTMNERVNEVIQTDDFMIVESEAY